jgi:hypothetical protein
MGYYENPPIIERAKSGELIGAGIERAAASIAGGIQTYAANVDRIKKEREAAVKKERDERNRIELLWNNKKDDWSAKQDKLSVKPDQQIYDIVGQRIKEAADAEIGLLSETSGPKRQELLSKISLANKYIDGTAEGVKALGGELAVYSDSAGTYGQPGGYVINGVGDLVDKKMGAMNVLTQRTQGYDDSSYNVTDDGEGGFNITAKWKKKGEDNYNEYTFNSTEYLVSDKLSNNSFLIKVPDRNENIKQAKETFFDKDQIRPGYLSTIPETINIESKGRQMEMVGVRRLEMPLIIPAVEEKSDIEATGWVNGSKTPEFRAFVDITLGKDRGYFDKNIAPLTPEEQQVALKKMLTENTLEAVTKNLTRTKETDKDGNETIVYWESKDAIVSPKREPKLTVAGRGRGGSGKVSEAQKNYDYAVTAVKKVMDRGQGTLFGTQERQLRVKDGIPTLWKYDSSFKDYIEIPLSEEQIMQGVDGLAASIGVYDRKRNKPFLPVKTKKKSKLKANAFGEDKTKGSFLGNLQNTVELP